MTKSPNIVTISNKKLVGHSIEMSLVNNKTFELFSGFMPKRTAIENALSDAVFEVMIYTESHFKNFSPTNTFEKWATFQVSNYEAIPEGMKTLDINEGLYAEFNYKGLPQDFGNLMRRILTEWLPQSEYKLDNRPFFNVLGDKYVKDSPDSEEEVFIPVLLK